MKNNKLYTLVFLLFAFVSLNAQNHFLVELESRSPDVMSLVKGYEGFPSIPFSANDINGDEQNLFDFKAQSKNVILWFWNLECPKCNEQVDALNMLQEKYKDDLKIVSFADDSKEDLQMAATKRPYNFSIVPNSKTLADGPYGEDLGYPRIFVIDEYGVIKWVFPQDVMKQNFDVYNVLETLHIQLKK
jgi:peroxiredoxin